MVILHIASVNDDLCAGVSVAVPQHIISQQNIAEVGFINLTNIKIEGIKNQFEFRSPFSVKNLESPFSNPDIVIFHEIYRPQFFQISRNLRKNNIPYIILAHGGLTIQAQSIKKLKKKIANPLFFDRFINGAVAVQCLSQFELDTTKKHETKFIATNGIGVPAIKKDSFNKDKTELVYVGRLAVFHKGLDILLEAVSLVKDYLINESCTISIYGPSSEDEMKKIELIIDGYNLHNIVNLHPAVCGAEKENVLLCADIFIQTSRFEGMPMGILEAMSYGIPCIITKGTTLGGFVEHYDSGWVAETNAESISETIKKAILDRENWKNKSFNARNLVENEFSWEKVSSETVKVYEDIIRE